MAEHLGEPVDSRVPESLVGFEPVVRALERARVDPAVVNASANSAFHEPCLLQRLDVLRCRGKRHPVGSSELSNGLFPLSEPLEHRSPGAVTERAKDKIESLLFNHKVEYIASLGIVNRSVEYL